MILAFGRIVLKKQALCVQKRQRFRFFRCRMSQSAFQDQTSRYGAIWAFTRNHKGRLSSLWPSVYVQRQQHPSSPPTR